MGDVQTTIVTQWNGISAAGEETKSDRKGLDFPREIVNFLLDDNGHLFMPRAVEVNPLTLTGEGSIMAVRFISEPTGAVIQTEEEIYFLPEGELTALAVATPTDPEWRIWAVSGDGASYIGYGGRGTSSTSQTWKIVDDGMGGITVTEPSDQPDASYSTFYKGRRFVVFRGREVKYSELNDFENFPEDNTFTIGGDDGGNSAVDQYGFVKGMVGWENVLYIFLTGSVWALTGADPNRDWQLTQVQTVVGNTSEWTLVPGDIGIFTYGSTNLRDDNFFVFTGNKAQNVSLSINQLVPFWVSGIADIDRNHRLSATTAYGLYIVGVGQAGADNEQLLVWNPRSGQWTSFDGFVRGEFVLGNAGRAYYVDGINLWETDQSETLRRYPGRDAYITMGWHDEENFAGLSRILGVKVAGKYTGTGNPTITVSAKTPSSNTVTSSAIQLTDDVFDGIVIPVNIRGNAVEITLTVTPANADNTVVIESMQVISSRKGEKVSRG